MSPCQRLRGQDFRASQMIEWVSGPASIRKIVIVCSHRLYYVLRGGMACLGASPETNPGSDLPFYGVVRKSGFLLRMMTENPVIPLPSVAMLGLVDMSGLLTGLR